MNYKLHGDHETKLRYDCSTRALESTHVSRVPGRGRWQHAHRLSMRRRKNPHFERKRSAETANKDRVHLLYSYVYTFRGGYLAYLVTSKN